MNVLIIYFSQTGNTKKIAGLIQDGIINSENRCDMVPMSDVKKEQLMEYDLIGIGTPTFFYREPGNVKLFIQAMNELTGKHCFLFCTHGSIIGNTFYFMKEELIKKGLIVIGKFDSYASSSIQFYPQPMHTEGHPDQIEIKEAEEFGKSICDISERIKNGENGLVPEIELISDKWWLAESENLTLEVLRKISPEFKINPDKCNSCLQCQEDCPVGAIDMETDPPEIQKEGCISCWYCEKSCPAGAIEADWSFMEKATRGNLLKYIEALKEAEELGRFRPYIDYKNIR